MVDNLNNTDTGTAMQAHKPVDDGWNSPIDDEGAVVRSRVRCCAMTISSGLPARKRR